MSSLASLLACHKHLSLTPKNRIVCSYTAHEMPPRLDVVNLYLASATLKKAKDWYSVDYSMYLPYIIPHKSNPKQLFCTLTREVLSKVPEKVKKHVEGKRFLRLKLEAEEKKLKKMSKSAGKKVSDDNESEDEDEDEEPDFWMPEEDMDADDNEEADPDPVADEGNTYVPDDAECEGSAKFDDALSLKANKPKGSRRTKQENRGKSKTRSLEEEEHTGQLLERKVKRQKF